MFLSQCLYCAFYHPLKSAYMFNNWVGNSVFFEFLVIIVLNLRLNFQKLYRAQQTTTKCYKYICKHLSTVQNISNKNQHLVNEIRK